MSSLPAQDYRALRLPELAASSGLREEVIQGLNQVFQRHPAVRQVVLYGSRAMGNWRNGSDIDLAMFAPALSRSEFLAIARELDDLLLPWKLDLALHHQIDNPSVIAHIARVGITFYPV